MSATTRNQGESVLPEAARRVLVAGTLISFLLMVIGLSYAVVVGMRNEAVDTPELLRSMLLLEPAGIVGLGVIVMLLTPVVNVFVLGLMFMRQKDRWFALIALLVLGIMAANVVLAGR